MIITQRSICKSQKKARKWIFLKKLLTKVYNYVIYVELTFIIMRSLTTIEPDSDNRISELILIELQREFSQLFGAVNSILENADAARIHDSSNFTLSPEQVELVAKIDPNTLEFVFPITPQFIVGIKERLKNQHSAWIHGHQALIDTIFQQQLGSFLKGIKGVKVVQNRDGFVVLYSAKHFIARMRDILYTNFHTLMKEQLIPYLNELVRITNEYEVQYYNHPTSVMELSPLLESLTEPWSEELSIFAWKWGDYFIWKLKNPIVPWLNSEQSIDLQDWISFRDLVKFFLEAPENSEENANMTHWTNVWLQDGSKLRELIFPRWIFERWLKENLDLFVLQNNLPIEVVSIFPSAKRQMPQYIQFRVLTPGQHQIRKIWRPFRNLVLRLLEPIQGIPVIRQRVRQDVSRHTEGNREQDE